MLGQRFAYRADIDGLRAIAVLAVVLYHLDISYTPGGFVGVDVFFVISGFLITRLLVDDFHAGRASYLGFLIRRFRRLYPALIIVVVATATIAFLTMPPPPVMEAVESAIYALASASNVFFWMRSGYFDTLAIYKPLLHTWSLGVEWQLYLVWPFLVWGALGTRRRWALPALVALCLVGGLMGSIVWLEADPAGAYFMMPARVFEFAIGASLVILPIRAVMMKAGVANATAIVGLVLILYSSAAYGPDMLFPGIAALVPCLGAACIVAGNSSAISRVLLCNRISVGLGQVSYSIYLIHWPLIVFLANDAGELTVVSQVLVVVATIALALPLHVVVEKRMRRHGAPRPAWWAVGVAAVLAVGGCGAAVQAGVSAWTWRSPASVASVLDPQAIKAAQQFTWARYNSLAAGFKDDGRPKVLILGDSQAADFINVLANTDLLAKIDVSTIASYARCQVLTANDFYTKFLPDFAAECIPANAQRLADPRLAAADILVLAFGWKLRQAPFVVEDIAALRQRFDGRIVVVGPKEQGIPIPMLVAKRGSLQGNEGDMARLLDPGIVRANALLSKAEGVTYIDLLSVICPDIDRCAVLASADELIFYDHAHLTAAGANYLASTSALDPLRHLIEGTDIFRGMPIRPVATVD